jgi:hypothetical protein
VFHDYSGNGSWESDREPVIPAVVLNIGNQQTTSSEDGTFAVSLPSGEHHLSVDAPARYRYFTPSLYQEIPLEVGLEIGVGSDGVVKVPLVEGPYRSPFPSKTEVSISVWVDLDTDSCFGQFPDRDCASNLDWLEGNNTYDGHGGTDFEFGEGILAEGLKVHPMRSGVVWLVRAIGEEDGYEVIIKDSEPYRPGQESYQMFAHLRSVSAVEGQQVNPSTAIGGGTPDHLGKIHVGMYPFVPKDTHPLDGDARVSPHADRYACPFNDRLWTGLGAFHQVTELVVLEGFAPRRVYP